MNERIKELWDQSKTSGVHPEFGEYDMYSATKFAELLIRECLDIVNRKEYSYHEADPLWETTQLIKEHFGVK